MLFTLYGVPTVYYGDEMLTEGCKDPFNRSCMTFENEGNEVYLLIKKLAKIRKENLCLASGETRLYRYDNGIISFTRNYNGEEIQVIVNLSNYVYVIDGDGRELLTNTTKKSYELEKYSAIILKRRNV